MGDGTIKIVMFNGQKRYTERIYKNFNGYKTRKGKGVYHVDLTTNGVELMFQGKKNSFLDGKYKSTVILKDGEPNEVIIDVLGEYIRFKVLEVAAKVAMWVPDWQEVIMYPNMAHPQMASRLQEKKFKSIGVV